MSMSTGGEFCSAVFKAFAPPDTGRTKHIGVRSFTLFFENEEVPGYGSIIERQPTGFVVLDIVFDADFHVPESRTEGYFGGTSRLFSGGWFRGSYPLSIRMRRDEMAEKLGFSKGQKSAPSS